MSSQIKIINKKLDVFEKIKKVVNDLVDTVRPTYGPASNKVIISKLTHSLVVDDGVQIARDFESSDPIENAIVRIIREVAIKTNDRVGDGTTSSLIMLQSIINEVSKKSNIDGRKIELELKKAVEEVKEILTKSAKQIKTKEDLKKVAMISFDNEKIAEMIADLYIKLGKDGLITIDKSPTMETTTEMTEGIKINSGYISPYMIINPERMESVIEKPYILITDYRITEVNDILPIMNKMAAENKRELVIIAENLEQNALATAVLNKIQGKFLIVAITAPSGDNRKVFLEDVALLTGGKMFTESKGDKLQNCEIKDLGRAERFICRQEESIIVGPKGNKKDVSGAVSALRKALETETTPSKKDFLTKRIGMYTNTVAVIKVGAMTENEQKALKYKVEDALNAVKSAYKHGVVRGAGLSLANIETSSSILNESLKYPAKQLLDNMGMDVDLYKSYKKDSAVNVVTGKEGHFLDVGVVDPVDVLIAGCESAVSIASMLITSSGMIIESQKEVNNNN
jgi:chaperonin GroEL